MKGLEFLDMEKASEYLNIAATIIEIKARSLVPLYDEDWGTDNDEESDFAPYDPATELIQALEEYQTAKLRPDQP